MTTLTIQLTSRGYSQTGPMQSIAIGCISWLRVWYWMLFLRA